MKAIVIALAFGDIYTNEDSPKLIRPLDGSISRLIEGLRKARELRANTLQILCTAGYGKINPRKSHPNRKVSLAKQIEKWILESDTFWGHCLKNHLTAEPLCWSTRNEIRVGIKKSLRLNLDSWDNSETHLIVASNWAHLPRIWLYTKLYTPKTWKVHLVRAKHRFSLTDHVLEIPKIARDILYVLKVTDRLNQIRRQHLSH